MAGNDLFDTRASFWNQEFEKALSYEDYLSASPEVHQKRWQSHRDMITLDHDQQRMISSFTRTLRVLVLSGVWCGDCARQGPIIQAIAERSRRISVRFADNQQAPELRDELRIHGAARVPVAVFLSEDWFEVGRFGDRTLSAYRRKAATELGAACDAGIVLSNEGDLRVEVSEWLELFERSQLLLRLAPALRRRYGD